MSKRKPVRCTSPLGTPDLAATSFEEECTCGKVQIKHSRIARYRLMHFGRMVVRHRKCDQCSGRFITVELPAMRTPNGWAFGIPNVSTAAFFYEIAKYHELMRDKFTGMAVPQIVDRDPAVLGVVYDDPARHTVHGQVVRPPT